LANSLANKYQTRNPFKLCDELDYLVLHVPLVKIRGFYQYVKRCHIIYINNNLDEREAAFVCAHEIGHSLLHKGINHFFMDKHTHFVTSRYEIEANKFAVDLLFDDYDLQELLERPITTVAECLGVSVQVAEYRMRAVPPSLFPGLQEGCL